MNKWEKHKGSCAVVVFLQRLANCSNFAEVLFSVLSAHQAQCGSKEALFCEPRCACRAEQQEGRRMDDIWLKWWHPARLLFPPVVMCSCYAQCIQFWRGPFPPSSVPGKGRHLTICVLWVVLWVQSSGSKLAPLYLLIAAAHTLLQTLPCENKLKLNWLDSCSVLTTRHVLYHVAHPNGREVVNSLTRK